LGGKKKKSVVGGKVPPLLFIKQEKQNEGVCKSRNIDQGLKDFKLQIKGKEIRAHKKGEKKGSALGSHRSWDGGWRREGSALMGFATSWGKTTTGKPDGEGVFLLIERKGSRGKSSHRGEGGG